MAIITLILIMLFSTPCWATNWTADSTSITDVAAKACMYSCNDGGPGNCTSINQTPNPCVWGGTCQPALMMCSDNSGQCVPGNDHYEPGSSCNEGGGTCTAYYNADLQAGDTVTIPSGAATWSGVALLLARGITIKSAGNPSSNPTTITLNSGSIGWSGGFEGTSTLQNITFITNVSINVATTSVYPIRITGNHFTNNSTNATIGLSNYALIDNNTFIMTQPSGIAIYSNGNGLSVAAFYKQIGWGELWSSDIEWNFIEHNTFNGTEGYQASSSPVIYDANGGGNKVVFRYNTMINMDQIVAHATCWSGVGNPGSYAIEAYNNLLIYQNGYTMRAFSNIMGGTALFHGNELQYWGTGTAGNNICSEYNDGTWDWVCPHNWQDSRTLDTTHSCNTGSGWQHCTESDQPNQWCSTTAGGIPGYTQWTTCNATYDNCSTLVGTGSTCSVKKCLGGTNAGNLCLINDDCAGGGTCSGYLDNASIASGRICFNGTGAGGINTTTGLNDSAPMYFWNNWQFTCDADGTNCVKSARVEITKPTDNISDNCLVNTDYFNESSAVSINGSSIGYTIATCPHPLTGLTGSCNSSVAGLSGYNVNSPGITFHSPQAGDGSMQRSTGGTGSITY